MRLISIPTAIFILILAAANSIYLEDVVPSIIGDTPGVLLDSAAVIIRILEVESAWRDVVGRVTAAFDD